jgi:hypothetical protein
MSIEEENLDSKTVFTIKHSEIPKGITQCLKHEWIKKNDHELKCAKCPTEVIIDPLKINNYINQNGNK